MKYALVGLGAMGMGMAKSMLKAGLDTVGIDIQEKKREEFKASGGKAAESLSLIVDKCDVIVLTLVNSAQIQSVLDPLLSRLPQGSLVISCSTVSPDFIKSLETRLAKYGVKLLDAPISGGSIKAQQGKITVMASGKQKDLEKANDFLKAVSEKIFHLGKVGQGSAVKVVHQLLAGVHIAAAAEAVAMGSQAGIDPAVLYDVVTHAAGNSWMFENRVPHIIADDYSPHSTVNIFIKDLSLVQESAEAVEAKIPLALSALAQFKMAGDLGYGNKDDAAVIKTYLEK